MTTQELEPWDIAARWEYAVAALKQQGRVRCPQCAMGSLILQPGEVYAECPDCQLSIQLDAPYRGTELQVLEAENARLRAGLAGLRQAHVRPCHKAMAWETLPIPLRCTCGADEHNARIDAILAGGT